jgi:hypothetical protein
MIRRLSVLLLLSLTVPGPLPAAAGRNDAARSPADPAAPARAPEPAAAKINDGRVAVTRSDGSAGRSKIPDPKEIRKLVGYMRDGMARADRAEKQKATKRVNYRPARSKR